MAQFRGIDVSRYPIMCSSSAKSDLTKNKVRNTEMRLVNQWDAKNNWN